MNEVKLTSKQNTQNIQAIESNTIDVHEKKQELLTTHQVADSFHVHICVKLAASHPDHTFYVVDIQNICIIADQKGRILPVIQKDGVVYYQSDAMSGVVRVGRARKLPRDNRRRALRKLALNPNKICYDPDQSDATGTVNILGERYVPSKHLKQWSRVICMGDATALDSLKLGYYWKLLNDLHAPVWPSLRLQRFVYNKCAYYGVLQKHAVPVLQSTNVNLLNTPAASVHNTIENTFTSDRIVIKPNGGQTSNGVIILPRTIASDPDVWPNIVAYYRHKKPFERYSALEHTYKSVCIQPYVPTLRTLYEIRSFWFAGVYSHSVLTHKKGTKLDYATFACDRTNIVRVEGKEVDAPEVKQVVKIIGKQVHDALRKEGLVPSLLRIDIGCAAPQIESVTDCAFRLVVNEIECLPDFFQQNVKATPPGYAARIADLMWDT